ncbi:hypothetical protein ACFQV2_39080 [Actinokineospora soli]|uniref:Uncharacterized protein n=1 Tax=Actinokineospora soli TaxID=1048753 RepID=A0ABW2TZG5_9PSEU
MGALPQLYAATHPDVESGQFIGPNGRREQKGYPALVEPSTPPATAAPRAGCGTSARS